MWLKNCKGNFSEKCKENAAVLVQLLSCVWPFESPCTAASQTSLSFTTSQRLLRFLFIMSMMLSNHLLLCHLFTFCLQSFPALGSFPYFLEFVIPRRPVFHIFPAFPVFLNRISGLVDYYKKQVSSLKLVLK